MDRKFKPPFCIDPTVSATLHSVKLKARTQWQGELPRDEAHVEDTAAGAVEVLRSTIPELPLHAFPPGQHYDDKRAHVEGAVRACYEHAISELLEHVETESI